MINSVNPTTTAMLGRWYAMNSGADRIQVATSLLLAGEVLPQNMVPASPQEARLAPAM